MARIITPGTKIRMGAPSRLYSAMVLEIRNTLFQTLIGMHSARQGLLAANGIGIGAVVAHGVEDTAAAYIYRQNPERLMRKESTVHPPRSTDGCMAATGSSGQRYDPRWWN